eukprot:CAMPEP_0206184286 /NCGR_PEP_ID=MMETSP0166-20121206/1136_1 /ASSEMBLY_ACC=CAM_ASM_000260 /TAXON_ID=95228 /ORGANISM="Vannella robusta, Strain DIVA3 518/3/11/1/6" /LENGTH=351 /DNA_ID=CAMNT_0053599289 /DNA_START=718 /DNA_END=1770 /DNA_ORIENTATION=-
MHVQLQPGTTLEGYYIQQKIGEGAAGCAYTALSPQDKTVVLKLVPLKNSVYRKEYKKEASHLRKFVKTPEIVTCLDRFVSGFYGVIVMEKLEMDLLDYIEAGTIPSESVKIIFKQICDAVLALHQKNIAHLDIKPENIFLNDIYSVKLGDFGASFRWSVETPEKFGLSGTSFYCAPEVKQKDSYKPAEADIWSLGILLHVLLTGFWPYAASTEEQLCENTQKGIVTIQEAKIPKDEALLSLMRQMLSRNPKDRPSVSEVCSSRYLRGVCTGTAKQRVKTTENKETGNSGVVGSCSIPNLADFSFALNPDDIERLEPADEEGQILLSPKGVRSRRDDNKNLSKAKKKRRSSW